MIKQTIRLLLIEDETFDVRRVEKTLHPFKDKIQISDVVADGESALKRLRQSPNQFDVIVMDFQISGSLMGENLIREIKRIDPTYQIIVMTKLTINSTDFDFANRLLEAGAMWYCTKYPGDIIDSIYQPTDFILSIYNAYEKRRLEKQRLKTTQKLQKNIEDRLEAKPLIGQSPYIKQLMDLIAQVAQTDTSVLIEGASGTGKELVANHIHYQSPRKYEEFVPVNCGSLPENLIESELFGYQKGAFTGATQDKKGLFEVAHKGTIFLDEIAEIPPKTQATLLRVLQEGEIDKIGRSQKIQVDVRIIAATNMDLKKAIRDGLFREDLYYRLNVVPIRILSLKERRDDIPLLVDHFLLLTSQEMNRPKPSIQKQAMDQLIQYEWPGNIRELQNVIQRLLFFAKSGITEQDVQLALGVQGGEMAQDHEHSNSFWSSTNMLPWREMERELRRAYFEFVRSQSKSDAEAARKLGFAPPNYHRICKELGLK
ncbi:sigma-54-dependent Fis family transcriptional regulator [candidate division KSB1 bacterium]|nr:sigma-54-dependent Fis family transcriptional regulator [candidate division KSB1 bacterium]